VQLYERISHSLTAPYFRKASPPFRSHGFSGEAVLGAGSRTGRLMILKKGTVAIVKDGVEIARGRSLAPYSANSRFCWISRTRQMPHSFTLRMRHFSQRIRSHSSTLLPVRQRKCAWWSSEWELSPVVQPAFLPVIMLPPPAPSPLGFAWSDGARTWRTADRHEPLIMERIDRNPIY